MEEEKNEFRKIVALQTDRVKNTISSELPANLNPHKVIGKQPN